MTRREIPKDKPILGWAESAGFALFHNARRSTDSFGVRSHSIATCFSPRGRRMEKAEHSPPSLLQSHGGPVVQLVSGKKKKLLPSSQPFWRQGQLQPDFVETSFQESTKKGFIWRLLALLRALFLLCVSRPLGSYVSAYPRPLSYNEGAEPVAGLTPGSTKSPERPLCSHYGGIASL